MAMVRGAEAFARAEGNIAGVAMVRCWRAPWCQRTHARPHAFCRDPGRRRPGSLKIDRSCRSCVPLLEEHDFFVGQRGAAADSGQQRPEPDLSFRKDGLLQGGADLGLDAAGCTHAQGAVNLVGYIACGQCDRPCCQCRHLMLETAFSQTSGHWRTGPQPVSAPRRASGEGQVVRPPSTLSVWPVT